MDILLDGIASRFQNQAQQDFDHLPYTEESRMYAYRYVALELLVAAALFKGLALLSNLSVKAVVHQIV